MIKNLPLILRDLEIHIQKMIVRLNALEAGGGSSTSGDAVGSIKVWPVSNLVPTGYIVCDGQSLNASVYPDLFKVIGHTFGGSGSTFKVPNFKGLIPRGSGVQLVNGRSKDGGVVGQVLEDQMQRITGEFIARRAAGQFSGTTIGVFSQEEASSTNYGGSSSASHTKFTLDTAADTAGNVRASSGLDGETRPSTLSVLFLIKAYNLNPDLVSSSVNALDVLNAEVQSIKANLPARYVVATHSSGNDWYEVYNDGWVRQGKWHTSGGSASAHNETVTFQIAMENTNYSVYTSYICATSTSNFYGYEVPGSRAVDQMQFRSFKGHHINFIVEGWGDSVAVKALGANPGY